MKNLIKIEKETAQKEKIEKETAQKEKIESIGEFEFLAKYQGKEIEFLNFKLFKNGNGHFKFNQEFMKNELKTKLKELIIFIKETNSPTLDNQACGWNYSSIDKMLDDLQYRLEIAESLEELNEIRDDIEALNEHYSNNKN
jgi:hypothetical protein